MNYVFGSRLGFINDSELLAAHLTSLMTSVEHTELLAAELILLMAFCRKHCIAANGTSFINDICRTYCNTRGKFNFNFKVWHPRCVLIQCIKSG